MTNNYTIRNIYRGKTPDREHIIYASLYDGDSLTISATLDYVTKRMRELIPKPEIVAEDEIAFGQCFVYCDQHLRPHTTGWCSVSSKNKIPLNAKTIEEAYEECKHKGFKLHEIR